MIVPLLALVALLALPAPASASITGGQETRAAWPFMALVEPGGRTGDGQQPFCGGTLVAPGWVLTAAHCLPREGGDLRVVLGRRYRSAGGTGERIAVSGAFVHPGWWTDGDDVALLELAHPPRRPRPVLVAGPGEEDAWAAGAQATVLGWGATEEGGEASDALRQAQLPIVADPDCEAAYAAQGWSWIADGMLCAGYPEGGTDTCEGDSGGPLLVRLHDGSLRLAGVTSFGEGCGRSGYPGVYAEAAGPRIRPWIRSVVAEAVAEGPGGAAAAAGTAPATAPYARARRAGRAARRAACRRKARRIESAPRRKRALKRCARMRYRRSAS